MRRSLLPLPLILATTAVAQTIIVPSVSATQSPSTAFQFYDYTTIYSTASAGQNASRSQLIYDVNDITPVVAVWSSLAVRRPVGLGNVNYAFTANATIQLNVGPNAYGSTTTNFASNLGTGAVTVFSSTLSLPASSNPGSWPAPWQTPIPFSAPFTYVKPAGQALVVDILQTGNTGTSPWYLEAAYPDSGTRAENPINGSSGYQPNCKFSNGVANGAIGYYKPVIGGNWTLNYQGGLPVGLAGVGALAAVGAGGTWSGIPLPIDLTPYNAPNCKWGVAPLVTFGLVTNANGLAQWPNIPIPNSPGLGGAVFYDHALFLDPPANAWGVVTTWSSKWIVGNNKGVPAAEVYVVGSAAATATTGTRLLETGTTLQLN